MTVWPEAASTTTASRLQSCVTVTRHYSVTTVTHHRIQGFSRALYVGQAGQLSSSSLSLQISINTNKFHLSVSFFFFKTALKGKKISEILVVNIAWLVRRKASVVLILWSVLNTHQPYSLATSQACHMPAQVERLDNFQQRLSLTDRCVVGNENCGVDRHTPQEAYCFVCLRQQ